MTSKALTQQELDAATKAIEAVIAANVPGWQQGFIPQDVLIKGVHAVVAAIDIIRDQPVDPAPNSS